PATTEIYTLSLHDALPISGDRGHSALGGVLLEGRDPRQGLGGRPPDPVGDGGRRRRDDGLLHVPPDLPRVPRVLPGNRRAAPPPARIAALDDGAARDPRGAVG